MGESFQILRPSSMRASRRRVCSSGLTSSQYLSRMIPECVHSRSKVGTILRNSFTSSSAVKPITRSTPARLYQLRSKITTSPAAGRYGIYRCAYICDFSRSVGAGSATTRNTRGLTRSVIALMVPPFPAPSRPSNTMQTLSPLCFTHSWSFTSSTCSLASSFSYAFRVSFSVAFVLPPFDLLPPSLIVAFLARYGRLDARQPASLSHRRGRDTDTHVERPLPRAPGRAIGRAVHDDKEGRRMRLLAGMGIGMLVCALG